MDLKDLEKPLLHVTHKRADPDSLAGVLWGVRVFGGCSFVDSPRRSTRNLMKKIGFKSKSCPAMTTILYDTNRFEDVPTFTERLIVVDHHPWIDPQLEMIASKIIRRPRASLSMNLYDMSVEFGVDLPGDVLLSFALALLTDTAILRTASSEELIYLAKFLNGMKMEEILKLAFEGVVDPKIFAEEVQRVEIIETDLRICSGEFTSEDDFMYFVDSFMYVMGCEVVVGKLEWGIWVYTEKRVIQKVYPVLKDFESRGFRRRGGRIFGLKNVEDLMEKLLRIS